MRTNWYNFHTIKIKFEVAFWNFPGTTPLTFPQAIHALRRYDLFLETVSKVTTGIDGERTKAHWDKSPLGQKPTGQYPTGQKPTAKFGRVDKSPLFEKKLGLSLL